MSDPILSADEFRRLCAGTTPGAVGMLRAHDEALRAAFEEGCTAYIEQVNLAERLAASLVRAEGSLAILRAAVRNLAIEMGDGVSPECSDFADRLLVMLGERSATTKEQT